MAIFSYDRITSARAGSNLVGTTAADGTVWVANSVQSAATVVTSAGRVRGTSGSGSGASPTLPDTPPGADYPVGCVFDVLSVISQFWNVEARALTSSVTNYIAQYTGSAVQLYAQKPGINAGAGYLQIGSSVSYVPPVSGSFLLIVSPVGTTISGYLFDYTQAKWLKPDGTFQTSKIAYTSGTDSNVTAAGSPGFAVAQTVTPSDSTGAQLREFFAGSGIVPGVATGGSVTSTTAAATATDCFGDNPGFTYQWYRSTSSGTLGSAVSGQTSLALSDSGLSPSTNYWYTLQYTDAAANTAVSNQVEVTTSAGSSPGLTCSPTSGSVVDASTTLAITPTLSNSSAALTASVSGGGTISTPSPTSGVAITYTPPTTGSGTATVTFTDATDDLTATCTVAYAPAPTVITITQAMLIDNLATGTATDNGESHILCSCNSIVPISTDHTAISFVVHKSINETVNGRIGLRINGVDSASIAVPSLGSNTLSITLSSQTGYVSGTNSVDLVMGSQSLISSTVEGTYPVSISGSGGTFLTMRTPSVGSGRVVVYGDSIATGAYALFTDGSTPAFMLAGWPALVRAQLGDGFVATEAYGSRQLSSDVTSSATTLATHLATGHVGNSGTHFYVINIGTNDYGIGGISASTFGTRYGLLLDAILAADAAAVVIAISPTIRTTETANGAGSTLDNFRSAIASQVSSRTTFARYYNGKNIFLSSDITDSGVHPGTAGQAKIANFVLGILQTYGFGGSGGGTQIPIFIDG